MSSRSGLYVVLRDLECLAPRHKGYFRYMVLVTFPGTVGNSERELRFQAFIDRLRKEVCRYVWVKEVHKSGLYHWHIVVAMGRRWHYGKGHRKRTVVDWSKLYCGSVNGIQVKPVRRSFFYVMKYLAKHAQKPPKGVRTWGAGGHDFARGWWMLTDDQARTVDKLRRLSYRISEGYAPSWSRARLGELRDSVDQYRSEAGNRLSLLLGALRNFKLKEDG